MAAPTTLIHGLDRLVTMDPVRRELASAYVVVQGEVLAAVGTGAPPDGPFGRVIDGSGLVALPGLINTHHHFFQTLTRVLPGAQDCRILDWMAANYPYWARIDAEAVYTTARTAIAELLLSGCSTTCDHLYAFPRSSEGADALVAAEIQAAQELGMRFVATRGAVDVSLEAGGSPPPALVEDTDAVLASMERLIGRFHDASPGAMCRIGLAPNSMTICSPRLMRQSGELARRHGVTRHTHVAEVIEEERYCLEVLGMRPIDRLEELGWIAPDVWLAHVVHVNAAEIQRLADASAGVAHCPTSNMRLASGAAPVLDMLGAGVAVGLGVDGSASNDTGDLLTEARHALLLSRVREQTRLMGARQALEMATLGGARALHRDDVGSLEVGKRADIAMFALEGVAGAGFEHDPVAGLVLGAPGGAVHVMVNGRMVVEDRALALFDEDEIARDHARTVARIVR